MEVELEGKKAGEWDYDQILGLARLRRRVFSNGRLLVRV
jgi:hypothetical protein